MGYFHLQATKPDTVAQGLTDSPSGLLTYILEKYSGWTFDYESQIAGKRDGGLDNFNKDELLTIISLYWFTNTISSSIRYYKGMIYIFSRENGPFVEITDGKVSDKVAVGVQYGINELALIGSKITQLRFPNLIQYKILGDCGHFGAFQKPETTAQNFIGFIKLSLL